MFRFLIVLVLLVGVFSFTSTKVMRSGRSMVSMMSDVSAEPPVAEPPMPAPVPPARILAKWFPFGGLKAPKALDGSLAGDVGFDPLGFSKSTKTLYWMREAEIKHSRLAMLAAVGWPISELFHKEIAQSMGWTSILASNDRAPSLLNGGLSAPFASGTLIMSIIIAGYLESKAMNDGYIFWSAEKPKDYVPGDYGFDPLSLYKVRAKKDMQTAEIKNGRLAMLAITGYAFSEFATKLPVVQETPYLF